MVDVLLSIIDLDMKSVSSLVGNLKLQVVEVLTVSVASWAVQAELGLEMKSVKRVTR